MSRTVSVRIDDGTYDAVANAADECGLSINDWLKLVIQQCLQSSEFKQSEDTGGDAINDERTQPVNITEEPKHVNPDVTSPLTPEMLRKWGSLIRDGKFTGSASEYQSYVADAAA
jgi:antitoxin component of RelBE/YafQ-DinJ toxin-antitoxin module